ncbi:MAG: TetR/AcrR family transcriptional regulator [Oscillospiraceae bacterium]|nr:TetR/AcrR family transcriptional regulator [Oscillospiraceae bacterium]
MSDDQITEVPGVHLPKTKVGLLKINALVDAAETLFSRSGFFDVSVSDICKKAHTAIGTFYIYFESKTDIYRYLVERYKENIRRVLADSISGCRTRREAEREGIKCFIRYAVANPNVYKIIWGSLAVEKQMFEDYYVSFAKSYANMLARAEDELKINDALSTAYMLMGITNFVGLQALFENMTDEQIDRAIDDTVMPILENGMFK